MAGWAGHPLTSAPCPWDATRPSAFPPGTAARVFWPAPFPPPSTHLSPPTFRTSAQGSSGSGREEDDEPGGLQRPGGSDPGTWLGGWTVAGERRLPEFLSTSPIPAGQLVGEALPSKSIVTDPGSSYVVVFHKIIWGTNKLFVKLEGLALPSFWDGDGEEHLAPFRSLRPHGWFWEDLASLPYNLKAIL